MKIRILRPTRRALSAEDVPVGTILDVEEDVYHTRLVEEKFAELVLDVPLVAVPNENPKKDNTQKGSE